MAQEVDQREWVLIYLWDQRSPSPQAFVECIQTREYMHVYNAIIVLKEILPVFPVGSVYMDGGPALNRAVDQFQEKEDRDNLKILAKA